MITKKELRRCRELHETYTENLKYYIEEGWRKRMTNKPHWCYRHLVAYTIMIWAVASVGFIIELFLFPFMAVVLAGEMLLEKMNVCYHPMKATRILWSQVRRTKK